MPTDIPQWKLVGDHLQPECYYVSEVSKTGASCLKFPLSRQQGELVVNLLNANPDWSIRFKRWSEGQESDDTLTEIMSWFIQEGVFTA